MVPEQDTKIIYLGNGETTHFPFTFKYNAREHIHVAIYDIATDTQTELNKDFFVDIERSEVIYPGYQPGQEPPEAQQPEILPTGKKLVIYRETPVSQEIDYGPKYPLPFVEDGTDKNTMMIQEIREELSRSVKVTIGSQADPNGLLNDIKQNVEDTLNAANGANEALENANNAADNAQQSAADAAQSAQDAKDWATANHGLWVLDDAGGLMPTSSSYITEDNDWELDDNGDVMPKEEQQETESDI